MFNQDELDAISDLVRAETVLLHDLNRDGDIEEEDEELLDVLKSVQSKLVTEVADNTPPKDVVNYIENLILKERADLISIAGFGDKDQRNQINEKIMTIEKAQSWLVKLQSD